MDLPNIEKNPLISYVGVSFENLPNSPTLASLQEHYICFTDDFYDACDKVYSCMIKDNIPNPSANKTYHIEKYDIPLGELQLRGILPYPINFFTFNAQFECICNRTKEIIWQP
jgi:hypothetical protein